MLTCFKSSVSHDSILRVVTYFRVVIFLFEVFFVKPDFEGLWFFLFLVFVWYASTTMFIKTQYTIFAV